MGFSLLFSIFAVWWAAPCYAALTTLIPADRRTTLLAIFNLGLTAIGGGLGPSALEGVGLAAAGVE